MESSLKISTLKKYARSFFLERHPDVDNGKAVYMHSATCGGFCDYACNSNRGHIIADDINNMEGELTI